MVRNIFLLPVVILRINQNWLRKRMRQSPTEIGLKPYGERADLEPDQRKLYDLIWKRFLSSQMADSLYAETQVKIGAQGKSEKDYLFKASGLVMQFDGWQVLYPRRKREDIFLPKFEEKETLILVKFLPEQKVYPAAGQI